MRQLTSSRTMKGNKTVALKCKVFKNLRNPIQLKFSRNQATCSLLAVLNVLLLQSMRHNFSSEFLIFYFIVTKSLKYKPH